MVLHNIWDATLVYIENSSQKKEDGSQGATHPGHSNNSRVCFPHCIHQSKQFVPHDEKKQPNTLKSELQYKIYNAIKIQINNHSLLWQSFLFILLVSFPRCLLSWLDFLVLIIWNIKTEKSPTFSVNLNIIPGDPPFSLQSCKPLFGYWIAHKICGN